MASESAEIQGEIVAKQADYQQGRTIGLVPEERAALSTNMANPIGFKVSNSVFTRNT